MKRRTSSRGVTLIDTLVGSALMLLVFVGVAAAFQLSVDVVTTNKARGGAIALANERMEYIRSLSYSAVGTSGGIPTGTIPQSENVSLNGVTYNRRTLVEYIDDSKDGSGGSDGNSIPADSKVAKVDISWLSRTGTRHVILVTRITPTYGLESAVSGGTLVVNAVDSNGAALPNAQVSVVNASTSVNLMTYTNASGTVQLIGTPASAGYQITVTKSGYSTAQTYSATAQNTNPNPANLTVSNTQTTSSTFAIDALGQKIIRTFTQIAKLTWTDAFSDYSKIATSSAIDVAGGTAHLLGPAPYPSQGEVQSVAIVPSYLSQWKTLTWTAATTTGTSIRYRVYDASGTSLVPDSQLPGNAAGFVYPPVDLSNVSTTTYTAIRLDAILASGASTTPSIDSWSVDYLNGPVPLPNLAFSMRGAKTIGTGPSGAVYKYSSSLTTDGSGLATIPNLEWDAYTITVNGTSTGYDIASSCAPQPENLAPGASLSTSLYFATHTANSLLVDVRSSATGALIPGASVRVVRTGYDTTVGSDNCGQSFFSGLSAASYSVTVSAAGYTTYVNGAVAVSGASRLSVSL